MVRGLAKTTVKNGGQISKQLRKKEYSMREHFTSFVTKIGVPKMKWWTLAKVHRGTVDKRPCADKEV